MTTAERTTSNHDETSADAASERDEVVEVQKRAHKENLKVNFWRNVVTLALVCTAVAVVVSTYIFLWKNEMAMVSTAFEQFSRSLIEAAIKQQRAMVEGYPAMAGVTSGIIESLNQTWPYVSVPKFEYYAAAARQRTGVELFTTHIRVTPQERLAFEEFTNNSMREWLLESHMIAHGNLDKYADEDVPPCITLPLGGGVFECKPTDINSQDDMWPNWHYSPPPVTPRSIMYDAFGVPAYKGIISALLELRAPVFSNVRPVYTTAGTGISEEEHQALHSMLPRSQSTHPHSVIATPIFKVAGDPTSKIVGVHGGGFAWDIALRHLLPTGNQTYTYLLDGEDAYFISEGDLHDPTYDEFKEVADLNLIESKNFDGKAVEALHCAYKMTIYPTKQFENNYHTGVPLLYALLTALTFTLVIAVFYVYDFMVQKRNLKMIDTAARSNAIVTSMFPDTVRDRLLGQEIQSSNNNPSTRAATTMALFGGRSKMKQFLAGADAQGQQIADLFLDTTVIFMDICGFTAWSSTRHPNLVFTLLQEVYQEFDRCAKIHRVFKIETIGDCYVAVVGVPDPHADHAAVAVQFAYECIKRLWHVLRKLETTLGPDTSDLDLRVGIHSGPVTAGVLQGDRARFSLFGDVVNTTSRMESTGKRGMIQVSEETASYLLESGRESWIQRREDKIMAKGKGEMTTYWIDFCAMKPTSHPEGSQSSCLDWAGASIHNPGSGDDKIERLIDWNVAVLIPILADIVARRKVVEHQEVATQREANGEVQEVAPNDHQTVLDEVKEIITLPEFIPESAEQQHKNAADVEISLEVRKELRQLVASIASSYRDNPFHNFEHASHVVMSVVKLLSRIVAPAYLEFQNGDSQKHIAATLHDNTYGITSDPLTQFACAFSAIIHDADHRGVSNLQLANEDAELAALYKGRSIAEQHSFDVSWELFLEDRFATFRNALCATQEELDRFRQLVVNCVMATDICDKELKALRNGRWEKAFTATVDEPRRDAVNRKATIVMEHLIQASDVSHTMQHWAIYRKWNANLFAELMAAYKAGRATQDPAEFWYKGEIAFFDHYIIPLAKKLKECGVFGVSSGEYLKHAMDNRREWEAHGRAVVAELAESSAVSHDTRLRERF